MIYSLENNFVFIHCPRTSGTAIRKSLRILVPDAVEISGGMKHSPITDLPFQLRELRSFTVWRSPGDIRRSYYRHIVNWYRNAGDHEPSTKWLAEHAVRVASMTEAEYMESREPPLNTDGYSSGVGTVFRFDLRPYREIASFCGVDKSDFESLMGVFRDKR